MRSHIQINKYFEDALQKRFILEIDSKRYLIDLLKKVQINLSTNRERPISDTVPQVTVGQWYWIHNKVAVPYNIKNNAEIEDAYLKKYNCVDIYLKRHSDDKDSAYVVDFKTMKQTNIKSGNARTVLRIENKQNAIVIAEDDEHDCGENAIIEDFLINIRIGGEKYQVDAAILNLHQAIEKLHVVDMIKDCYISSVPSNIWKENQFKIISTFELNKQFVRIFQKGSNVIFEGKIKSDIFEVKEKVFALLLKSKSIQSSIKYPPEWTDVLSDIQLRAVPKGSIEWNEIENNFKRTISNKTILEIQRIQNKNIWKTFYDEKLYIEGKRVKLNEVKLWHGTRNTKPQCIYEGDRNGFDYRYSSDGMWGQGIYFAENASYSDNYAHKLPNNTSQLLFCNVILGDCIATQPNKELRLPPAKDPKADPSKTRIDRYDSVEGFTGNSRVFIIYENSKAYPAYLVAYA